MPKKKKVSPPPAPSDKAKPAFPVVGIGSSAGGLEALEALFGTMPETTGAAFVVIQHMARGTKSMLAEILSKHTRMRVVEIAERKEMEPDNVYICPPDKEVYISDGFLVPTDAQPGKGLRLPIDYFFRSLAEERQERSICIILSGAGTDGTLGLKAIKEVGGMAMAQDPATARYDGMPGSAVSTGQVDFVLPVEKMPLELVNYISHPYIKMPVGAEGDQSDFASHLPQILARVRSVTGKDFSHYKQRTIRRRIERRMAVRRLDSIADYVQYLERHPAEIHRVFQEFLIGVTNFFRDPEAFESLREKVIPDIIAGKKQDEPIRVWVPGCSTGEEALSLAMLFVEAIKNSGKNLDLQIFGTDIDPDAIDRARKAEYPDTIAGDVPDELLKRNFTRKMNTFRPKSEIRESIIYAVQDLTSDPPFSRLDLVSCRNLLIYMDAILQKKIIPLFHFVLNSNGYLFLGSSETVGNFTNLFSPVDVKSKIYRLKKDSKRIAIPGFAPEEIDRRECGEIVHPAKIGSRERLDRILLEEYAPAAVLIDANYDALFFRGQVNRYFELPKGEATLNLLNLARPGLAHKLPLALRKATTEAAGTTVSNVLIKEENQSTLVDVTVRPLVPGGASDLFIIIIEEKTPPPDRQEKSGVKGSDKNPKVRELEMELQATRENLQTTIEELEAANEEQKSTNEELQSTNEEIQSTNEELLTAKEELQSANEELSTINSELQNKVDELSQVNNDVNNLLASIEIGTIFLGRDLTIKRFTPSMTKLFNLIPSDVGRSLKDITTKLVTENFYEDAESVLNTLQAREREVRTDEGRWFSMRILPYRTRENVIEGVVITFEDIMKAKRIEESAQKAMLYMESIFDTVREGLLTLDANLKVISANKAFYKMFATSAEETIGRRIYNLGNGQWDSPPLRELLEKIIPKNTSFEAFSVEQEFPSVGFRSLLLNARVLDQEEGGPGNILLAFVDKGYCPAPQ